MKKDTLKEVESVNVWYHSIELEPGVVTPGIYDMRPFLKFYGFPKDLDGMDVIDVGASNGFFSFHFEKLNANKVIAIDLASWADHDIPKWLKEKELRSRSKQELSDMDFHELHGGFSVAKKILGSNVEKRCLRIYELPELNLQFDMAFCGCILQHLRDPVGGLEAVREVLKPGGKVIIGNAVDLTQPDQSYAVFVGNPAYCSWWVPSPEGLKRMCKMAGFSHVEWISSFQIASKHAQSITDNIGIVHAVK